ncbi:methyltransferase [Amycolatopsis sp. NPDC059021]|uniref:methyltransferase n=1 Tax=Amycolatopsis sp. NPDC059021 TaxID=3346704 RepID=UPI00366C2F51
MPRETVETTTDVVRLGNAFCTAQVLLTAVELGVFTALADGAASEEELRDRLGLHGRGLRPFLALLAALGLLSETDGRYANAAAAAECLVADRPGYVGGLLMGTKTNLYPVWNRLGETLKTGEPQSGGDEFAEMLADPARLEDYARMMDGALVPLLPPLLGAIDWGRYRSVLDIGGCRGSLVGQVAREHPKLTGTVFDLPPLRQVCLRRAAELGVADRIRFHGGDFFRDPLPRADVVVLGHVLHNWAPGQREFLVRRAFHAVEPGGVLLVHDRMLDDALRHTGNLVVGMTMALVTENGSEYTVAELRELALAAGFRSADAVALDGDETLVVCGKA